ncbi:MAG: hypothetical protein IKT81_00080 [Clostridia bacterium]|nr:hypothetical protein [Clostridia bacterium]
MHEHRQTAGFSRYMFLHCLILFAGMCGGVWISKYFFVLMAVFTLLTSLISNIDAAFWHLLFSVSFSVIYKLEPTETSLFAYVMIGAGAILVLRTGKISANRLIAVMLVAIYLAIGMGGSYTTVVKMTVGAFLFYIFVTNIKPDNFKDHIMAYSLGMLGSSVIGTFRNSLPQLSEYFETVHTIYNNGQLAYRFTGLNYDPNYYAVSAVFAIILCFVLVINRQGSRLVSLGVFSALLVFGFQSYSKMFLLAAVVTGIIFMAYMMTTLRMLVALAFSGAAVGGVALWLQKTGYMDIMLRRLSAGDISTGRFAIWQTYLEHLGSHWRTLVLGDGLQAGYLSVGGPHNTYIEAIYFVGIVGSLLFLGMLILIFSARIYNRKRCIINYLTVFVFLVMIGVLGCLTINEFFFYCMLMWIGLNIPISSRKKPKGASADVQRNSPGI